MLSQSFVLLPKVGQTMERRIWQHAPDWERFQQRKSIPGISAKRKGYFDRFLYQARAAEQSQNIGFFNDFLPRQQHWRLYPWLKDEAVFLDIETSNYYGNITVIGLYDGKETKTLVRGFNLSKESLRRAIQPYSLIITFNGASFDLPVINRYFGNILPSIPHIDLRHVCSKIGLVGGLKIIEKQLDIHRSQETQFMDGEDAVSLWDAYTHTGNERYLDLLVKYNEEDIVNLKPLAEYAIPRLWSQVRQML